MAAQFRSAFTFAVRVSCISCHKAFSLKAFTKHSH